MNRNVRMRNDCDHKCPKAVGFSFPGYVFSCSECEAEGKKKSEVKRECIDEVAEAMTEVEKKLWLLHYDLLSEELDKVLREKCIGCQNNEPNQLRHELCLFASSEKQVDICFDEAYKRVKWDSVMDKWYKSVLEEPVALNREALIIFKETVNPEEEIYKIRMKKWLIESPTIKL